MKISKASIIGGGIVFLVLLMGVIYYMVVFGDDNESTGSIDSISIPELQRHKNAYKNRLEAVKGIEEEKKRTQPNLYNEDFFEGDGNFNPNKIEEEKKVLIDSIMAKQQERLEDENEKKVIQKSNIVWTKQVKPKSTVSKKNPLVDEE